MYRTDLKQQKSPLGVKTQFRSDRMLAKDFYKSGAIMGAMAEIQASIAS